MPDMPSVDGHCTYRVAGIPIAGLTPKAAAEWVVREAEAGRTRQLHLCNAYTLALADVDAKLRLALQEADLNLPDGAPVAWLGRASGTRGPVRGPSLVGDVAAASVGRDIRHFLYGGASGVAETMKQRLAEHVLNINIVGAESPPFREPSEDDLDRLAATVNTVKANILWVGLGTPRQDYVVHRVASRLSGVVIVPVGAAFDFWSGRISEAPRLMHGSGLEWLYRLAADPRRLARRYIESNPRFIRLVMKDIMHRVRGPVK